MISNDTTGGVWTSNNDNVTISNPTDNPTIITGVNTGKSYITYTVGHGNCQTKKTTLIKVLPNTSPTVIIGI